MNKTVLTLILASALSLTLVDGHAQETDDGATAEERQAARDERRAKWESLSEEEKQAHRERAAENRGARREAMRERWASMSDEERQLARERMREHRSGKSKGHRRAPAEADSSEE